ncbi:MAG TPA: dTMP kinase [Patescibacteria group bacterium]|nr:dTMP kinase [Patescibacteria group bacterium]
MTRSASSAARGRFITIEGAEGAGKTTQAARLGAALRARGVAVIGTREPGGTEIGERIRELLLAPSATPIDPLADALLFNAARRQLVEEVIEPSLAAGTTVICARFADSTRAYQGYGGGLALDELQRLEDLATGGLRPDLTLLLDVPSEIGLARKAPDDRTRFENGFDLAFHRRVRNGFLAIAVAEPERFVVLDATADEDVVSRRILRAVDALIGDTGVATGRAVRGEPRDPVQAVGEPNRPTVRTT